MALLLDEDRSVRAPRAAGPERGAAGPEQDAAVDPERGGASPEQGVIEEARRRQRVRRARVVVGCVLLAAGVGAIAVALGVGGSTASSGARRRVSAAAAHKRAGAAFAVRLSPALDGGQYGWCVAVQEPPYAGIAGGGCAMTPTASAPVAMRLSDASVTAREQSTVLVTTPQVAAVLVNGRRRVPTTTLPGLPYGLRAVRIVTPVTVRTLPNGRRGIARVREPWIVPLDARGHRLVEQPLAVNLAVKQPRALARPVAPVRPRSGPCSLRAVGVPGLAAQWSHVASAIRPFAGALVGHAFFSCIDTEYYLHGWPLDAAILLDAAHPGSPPAAIPGLQPLAGDAGYLNGSGDFKGDLTATRVGEAWLVVAGGSGLAQRLEVLRHLTATVRLPPHRELAG